MSDPLMNDVPTGEGAEDHKTISRPVTHANPSLQRAGMSLRRTTIGLGVIVSSGVFIWMLMSPAATKLLTGGWAVAGVAAMSVFSVLILQRVFLASQSALPGWLGLGYLGRILIVAGTLIGGRVTGAEVRVIGVVLIAIILLNTFAEVWLLSRARVLNTVPLDTSL